MRREDGQRLDLTPAQERLLGAVVAWGPGHTEVPISSLSDGLWPDSEADAARRRFDTTLLRLRRTMGREDALLLKSGRLSVNPAVCWVDVWGLEASLQQLERQVSVGASIHEIEGASRALCGCYVGDFLRGTEEVPGASATRERLRRRLARSLLGAGEALARGGATAAAEHLARWVEERNTSTLDVLRPSSVGRLSDRAQ